MVSTSTFMLFITLSNVNAAISKAYAVRDNEGDDVLIQTLPSLRLFKSLENKFYHIGTAMQGTWLQAMFYCKSHDMDLLSIESKEEHEFIQAHIIRDYGPDGWFWTSGNCNLPNNQFAWISTGSFITYTQWAPNEPSRGEDKCIALQYKAKEKVLLWHDATCESDGHATPICEVPVPQAVSNMMSKLNNCNLTFINVESN